MELRRISGLSWDELSKLLGTTRRALHLWISGKSLEKSDEVHLDSLLETIKFIDRGTASQTHSILFSPIADNSTPFDLLLQGYYQQIKDILGSIDLSQKPRTTPLSKESLRLRRPLDVETLVSADPTPVSYKRVGRSRPASSVKINSTKHIKNNGI